MKFDLHCHTAEGSSDSEAPIIEYIKKLISLGYSGMMVTDHDSYGGYNYYLEHREEVDRNFVVLKGVEYDTLDAGHFIVVLPDDVHLKVLEHKGLKVRKLIDIVHSFGGIVGAAHPCGEPFLSIFSTGKYRKNRSILEDIDFLEGFNCGEDEEANEAAVTLAAEYGKPVTGGSDSHWMECIGLAYTIFEEAIQCNNDFIDYILSNKPTSIWGEAYNGTLKARLGRWNKLLVYGFWPYNKLGALFHTFRRRKALREIKKDRRIGDLD